jgi:hypothetical protein
MIRGPMTGVFCRAGTGKLTASPTVTVRDSLCASRYARRPLSLAAPAGNHKLNLVTCELNQRVFLLSPAYAGGERARMIMSEKAQFDLAFRLRSRRGATIAEVFTFLSGLYFRGKIAYAAAFARPFAKSSGVFVITPTRGLVDAQIHITLADLREFAEVEVDEDEPRYRQPLERDARRLAKELSEQSDIVLLGSIATRKYVDVLLRNFGERLRFPADFVGRGDMSRGGLLLRCAADKKELPYVAVAGAILSGKRPPKLEPRRYPKGWPSH